LPMRYALECTVDARIRLPQDIDGEWFRGRRLVIKRDHEGFVSTIRIEGKVPDEDPIAMSVVQEPGKPTAFKSSGGGDIRRELQSELQLIESTLGLYCKLTRIRWEEATAIIIPESREEEQRIQWNNLRITRESPDNHVRISAEDFCTLLQLGNFARELVTTMSFFREGNIDLKTFRFITAFFSFYFILEGLYANGKSKNKEVCLEFAKSQLLRATIATTLQMPLYSGGIEKPGDIFSIDQFLSLARKRRDVEGVIHMLVWVRGDLHHFVNNPNKLTGSPFTHHRYETLAWFIHDVCLQVLTTEITNRHPEKPNPNAGL
jgi:hypothetical protein